MFLSSSCFCCEEDILSAFSEFGVMKFQPRSQVLSPTRRETLVGSGHVSPRIWEVTNKRLGGGGDKCEICHYKA